MTDKLTLTNLATFPVNDISAAAAVNANNAAIITAINNTLSRDGTTPNQMSANLDMNSNRILNLPAPLNDLEPLRLQDLNDVVVGASGFFTPQQFGSAGPSVTVDNTSFIQDAISAAAAVGGGKVYLSAGTWLHTGLHITSNYTYLEGAGGGAFTGATTLVYNGASGGIAVDWSNSSITESDALIGGGMTSLAVNCNFLATTGVRLLGWRGATFNNVTIFSPGVNGYALKLDETAEQNVQSSVFTGCQFGSTPSTGSSGVGLNINGSALTGGCTHNCFIRCFFFCMGDSATSNAIRIGLADNNTFIQGITFNSNFPRSVGADLHFVDLSGSFPSFPSAHSFINFAIPDGTDGVPGTFGNWIFGYNVGDGGTLPLPSNFYSITFDGYIRNRGEIREATTFANLPSSPEAGTTLYLHSNASAWGATITASGANPVLGFYNGANWTVAGK